MKPAPKLTLIGLLFLQTLGAIGCAEPEVAEENETAAAVESAPSVTFQSRYLGAGEVEFVLKNQSNQAVHYWGYEPRMPQLWVERMDPEGWVLDAWDWCGTGLEILALNGGQEVRLTRRHRGDLRSMRLGTDLVDANGEVLERIWSDPVHFLE